MTRRCLLRAARVRRPGHARGLWRRRPVQKPANGWVTVTDEPSGARIALPEAAEPTADTAAAANGPQVTLRQYTASAAGGAVEVGFNVLDTRGGRYDFDAGVREGRLHSGRPGRLESSHGHRRPCRGRRGGLLRRWATWCSSNSSMPTTTSCSRWSPGRPRRDLVEETFDHLTQTLDVEAS